MKAIQTGNIYIQITGILARSNGVVKRKENALFRINIAKKTMKSVFKCFCP